MGKQAFDKKMKAIEALRASPDPAQLRKKLNDRNNFLVSKAAAIVGELSLRDLIPDLVAAFNRFLQDPVKSDPKCWGKTAIATCLKDLDYDDTDLFIRGLRHIQMEPSFGKPEDSAVELRATCAMALVGCPLPRFDILLHLVDTLGADPAKPVRKEAARAIAQIPGTDSVLLLRLKALAGDRAAEVTGQCFVSLLEILPKEQLAFVAEFLKSSDPDVQMEAVAALGECHDPESAAVLIRSYQTNPNAELRRAILLSLGASRHAAAADFLLSLVKDASIEQATLAIQALAAGRFRDDYRQRVQSLIAHREDFKLKTAFEKEFRA